MYKIKRFSIFTTLGRVKQEGLLDGRVKFHHSTAENNVKSIMENGLQSKYADDPSNITNIMLDDLDKSKKSGKVYLAKNKEIADAAGSRRGLLLNVRSKDLDVDIPYEDFKKMKKVENPELKGAKNWKEFHKMKLDRYGEFDPQRAKDSYDILGKKGTEVIQGDIPSKYIKGGKGYQKNTVKDTIKYIKKNPGRFAKGLGLSALGLAKYPFEKLSKRL